MKVLNDIIFTRKGKYIEIGTNPNGWLV